MTTLYNCRHSGDQYRITKFDSHFNLESSYLCTFTECECPAGHRHTCRHREMLSKFIQREHVGDEWYFDYDRGGWVQGPAIDQDETEIIEPNAITGDGIPHLAGVYAKDVTPANAAGATILANSSFSLNSEPSIMDLIGEPEDLRDGDGRAEFFAEAAAEHLAATLEAPLLRAAPIIRRRV